MKDFVVYTVMVGGYGNLYQPECIDERFDYILFTTDVVKNPGIWQVRSFPAIPKGDNKRISRYPKTHPSSLLGEYKASLYQDANLIIRDRWVYDRCVELYASDANIAGVQLLATGRDCIYEHSFDMFMMRAEHDYNALRQMQALRRKGFPDHFGLNENNLIWRRHCSLVEKVDEEWWWWITNYSYRDQFSYMYCLWKNDVERTLFLPAGEDTNNSKHFTRINHNAMHSVARKKWIRRDSAERWRCFCRRLPGNREESLRQWVEMTRQLDPGRALQQWERTALKQYLKRIMKKVNKGKGTRLINSKYIHIGNDCHFGRDCRIEAVKEYAGELFKPSITIDGFVSMEDNCHIACAQSVTICNGTMIGSRVLITDHLHGDTVRENLSIRPALRPLKISPVAIGRNVWIGDGVSILPGVTLGDGVIVGANSAVTHSFPPGVVIAGCPAVIIRKTEDTGTDEVQCQR